VVVKIYVKIFASGVNVGVEVALVSALVVAVTGSEAGAGVTFVADNSPVNFGWHKSRSFVKLWL